MRKIESSHNKGIVTHSKSHPDEYLAELLARRYGGNLFPNIENVETAYVDAGTDTYQGMNGDQLFSAGYLALGVCGGQFDEHPRPGKPAKEHSCASLMFEYLLQQQAIPDLEVIAWMQVVDHVNLIDTENPKDKRAPLDLFSIVSNLHRLGVCEKTVKTLAWAALDAQFKCNLQAVTVGKKAFDLGQQRVAKCGQVEVKIVAVVSDCEFILQYAGFGVSGRPNVLIQFEESGNFQIFGMRRTVNLDDVIARLRVLEAEARQLPISNDPVILRCGGTVKGANCLYYQEKANRIFNGSLSAPGVEPTRLGMDVIIDTVVERVRFVPQKKRLK